MTQHKAPKQLAFKPLQQALQEPGELMLTDFSKIERPGLLHLGFQALDAFQVIPIPQRFNNCCMRCWTALCCSCNTCCTKLGSSRSAAGLSA